MSSQVKKIIIILIIFSAFIITGYYFLSANNKSDDPTLNRSITPTIINNPQNSTPTGNTTIANPASVYCVKQGGKLEIKTAPDDGSQTGWCNFQDGRTCEEWEFFRTKICE
ncbi:MAG: DUF333 domain-containing protein [Actinobacteria bacterium]|nr:DUF333 domain-containing protein [Actinomycetota bacterium]